MIRKKTVLILSTVLFLTSMSLPIGNFSKNNFAYATTTKKAAIPLHSKKAKASITPPSSKINYSKVVSAINSAYSSQQGNLYGKSYSFLLQSDAVTKSKSPMSLNKTSDSLTVGDSDSLNAIFTGANENVSWSSSNSNIVAVNQNGYISAINPGTATIIARSADGKMNASCTVIATTSTDAKQTEATVVAKEALAKIITPNMTETQRELAIHDYIVSNAGYDITNYNTNTIPDDDYTAYGILVNHIGVCSGYASAFKLMCDLDGINCQVVGDAQMDHAWNIVKLSDGNYYEVDATWDDPIYTNDNTSNSISHRYFNISDKELFVDHNIDPTGWAKSAFPKCNTDNSEFYSQTGVVAAANGNVEYANYNNELYKIDSAGNRTLLSSDDPSSINYYNGYIYYLNATDNHIYKIDTTGNNKAELSADNVAFMSLYNGTVYYCPSTYNSLKEVSAGTTSTVATPNIVENVCVYNGYDYYASYDYSSSSYILNKMNLNTLAITKITSFDYNTFCDFLNSKLFYSNYMYYLSGNSIYSFDANNNKILVSGNDNNINSTTSIFSNYIYYTDSTTGKLYDMNLNGTGVNQLQYY